jgi:DNA-binding response OmpR family regulator
MFDIIYLDKNTSLQQQILFYSGQTGMTSHTFTRGSTSETHWHICNFLVTFTVLDVMLNITTKNLILFDMRKTLMHGLFIIILMDLFNLN